MSGVLALVVLVVVPLALGLLAARWGSDTRDPRWSVWERDDSRTPVRPVVSARRDAVVRVHRSHGVPASSSTPGTAPSRRPSFARHAH